MDALSLIVLAAVTQVPPPALRADTVPPLAAAEQPYVVRSAGLGLGGTITMPRNATGPVPVAIIIAGSGPTDRNGNSLMGGIRPNSYAQLAWRLAERGIATLRADWIKALAARPPSGTRSPGH